HRRYRNVFTFTLIVSVIPEIMTQLYMVFGSTSMEDDSCRVAHFLKVVAYSVPMTGLVWDYTRTYKFKLRVASSKVSESLKKKNLALSQLRKTEDWLSALLDNSSSLISIKDIDGHYMKINKGYEDLFRVTDEDIRGRTDYDIFPKPTADTFHETDRKVFESESSISIEESIEQDDGTRTFITAKFPLRNIDDQIIGIGGISTDITDRVRMEAELRIKTDELQRSNEELDEFAYIASHDLKEPLRGISNYAAFVLEDYADRLDNDGKSKLETLSVLARRLDSLIDSLLYFSRLGRAKHAVRETNLNEVLEGVFERLRFSLDEANVSVRIPKQLPTIECDAVRVAEVYTNLITNAIKYNDKGDKWMEIGVDRSDESRSVFYVRDNGIGIKPNHIESVFKMFKRLHGRDKYGGGTGAGLAFVKKIVERHGGRIWVESTFGVGTTFYFTLNGEKINDTSNHRRHKNPDYTGNRGQSRVHGGHGTGVEEV
ncbi:MAG: ATP-binding protein, partial [candidate division Zixibacteria bacterium]